MRYGHASTGRENSRINKEIRSSLSRKRITVSLKYAPSIVDELNEVSLLVEQTVSNHFRGENQDESK